MEKLLIPPVFVLAALILITASYLFIPEYNVIPFPVNLAGLFVIFGGITMMGKARDLFKKYQTTLNFGKSSYLIQEGIFLKTRNPMYIGMFLMLLGVGICFGNLFSILIPIAFIVLIHFLFVLDEEKVMLETFGQVYLDYKAKVKRWL